MCACVHACMLARVHVCVCFELVVVEVVVVICLFVCFVLYSVQVLSDNLVFEGHCGITQVIVLKRSLRKVLFGVVNNIFETNPVQKCKRKINYCMGKIHRHTYI